MTQFDKPLSFCSWNINGLQNKLLGDKYKYVDFLEVMKKHDFILLTETWSNAIPEIEGYCSIIISPYKKSTKTSGRHSGGIALLYKASYKNLFEVVKSSNNSIWCRISKQTLENIKI